MSRRIIRIAAALLTDAEGHVLLVRKRGTTAFMQPGGKIDPGETPIAALVRELEEELGMTVDPASARHLGCFDAPAANEQDTTVQADLFHVATAEAVLPAAEIAEARWTDPDTDHGLTLAPLTRDFVLPLLKAMRLAA